MFERMHDMEQNLRFRTLNGDLIALRAAQVCAAMILLVGLLDVLFYFFELLPSKYLRRSFNIAREESFGTWVSTNISLFAGLAALVLALHSKTNNNNKMAIGWLVVGLFFLFVSFDDAAKFHERLGTTLRRRGEELTDTDLDSWFPSWGWQLYVMPFFAFMGGYLVVFLYQAVPARTRFWIYIGMGLLATAVSIDFVEGAIDRDQKDLVHLMRLCEEMIEMFGMTAFLYLFLLTMSNESVLKVASSKDAGG